MDGQTTDIEKLSYLAKGTSLIPHLWDPGGLTSVDLGASRWTFDEQPTPIVAAI